MGGRNNVDPRPGSSADKMEEASFSSTAQISSGSTQGNQLPHRREVAKGDVLGQLHFAPATQTTVVTTTTTTTTQFPPFVLPGPRQLDPKQYPLANTATPSALRNITFDVDGKTTIFKEADNATMALEQFEQQSHELRMSNGSLHSVKSVGPPKDPSLPSLSRAFTPTSIRESRKRPIPSQPNTHSRKRIALSKGEVTNDRAEGQAQARKSRDLSPATPPTSERHEQNLRRSARKNEDDTEQVDSSAPDASSFEASEGVMEDVQSELAPQVADSRQLRKLKANTLATPTSSRSRLQHDYLAQRLMPENVVPTPPIQEDDENIFSRPAARGGPSSIPSRLTTTDLLAGQDGSLPSPSLSPVTHAANLNLRNSGYFGAVDSSDPTLQNDADVDELGPYLSETPSRASMVTARQSPVPGTAKEHVNAAQPGAFKDVPAMLDFFEAIPDEFKSWVMHQILRRCPKQTLQLVADVVNPALKCDFLGMLPPELSLNVLKYLDAPSLCRASQVSRKWRHIINADEKAWKELFDRDGFSLPEGELRRAIFEGWGWQDPAGPTGCERDISSPLSSRPESDASRPTTPQLQSMQAQSLTAFGGSNRRSKRKTTARMSTRGKNTKRRETIPDETDLLQSAALLTQLENLEGPYNAANAASLAVPFPQVEMPSLKDLHLFKSLYRRHYLIRKSWMQEDVKPHHIAFRAHDRHVVTCLQFDTDKIITGSDDTNINVYDTKTGALRARLQGHEGGVWALQYEGNILVSGSTDRSVRVWDIKKGRQTQVFQGHTSTVRCLQILLPTKVGETSEGRDIMMPKQPLIITGSRDSNLRVWRLPQPGDPYYFPASTAEDTDCPYFVRILSGHGHSVRAIAAHADTLVSGSYDSTVRVWKISTGETIHRLQGHTQKVYSVVLDTTRNRCISGSMDNLVKIWSLDSGTCLYTLDGHSSLVGLLDLNSERLVSAAADSTLRIWDPENGQCKATLSAHTGAITCFQHDGQKVISGSDRTLKMWNVKTGECVKDLLTDLSGVWQVKFNERRCVAAVQRDNMTYVEVLDFGASRDGVPEEQRGRRIVVDVEGNEIVDPMDAIIDLDAIEEAV